jgi:hypothetical protein
MNSPLLCANARRWLLRYLILPFAPLLVLMLGISNRQLFGGSGQPLRQSRIHDQLKSDRVPGAKYHPSRILVRFKRGTSPATITAMHRAVNGHILRELSIVPGLQSVEIAPGSSVSEAVRYYRKSANVQYAEPDYYVRALTVPNDPQFQAQWSLQNTGQNGGTAGADIHATEAWSLSTGSANVVVGVIDTGLDYNHQDLSSNVWTAQSGFSVTTQFGAVVQCSAGVHGFNMVADTCDPMDDNGHGTHVSGTIGALGNNGIGVAGINWQVQLLPCKFLDATGSGLTEAAIACLDLMKQWKDSGVNVVVTNNSWGGSDASQALHDAIAAMMEDGILFIAAAGNDFSNNDQFPTYPANFYLPNVISVAATDRNDNAVTFSNLGRRTVHIAAPGQDILSTTPNNTYSYDSGTSMAAPHVTGVVALLKAQNPTLDWRSLKNLVLTGGDALPSLQQTISQRRLNAYGALTCANQKVASRLLPVADTISGSVGSPVTLAFLNISCAQPAGNVTVTVVPGNQSVTLVDDGSGADQAPGDGIYTAQWIPSEPGSYAISFPDGSTANVEVLTPYGYLETSYNYRTITGTNLGLGDDSVATVTSPFAIPFGGGSFTNLYVSSNGTISFTSPYDGFENFFLPPNSFVGPEIPPITLVAPYWMDLVAEPGTAQNVFWAVTGNAPNRELVVEWRNVRDFQCRSDGTATVTFQVVFREDSSDVLFNYSDTVFGNECSGDDYGQHATTGILSSSTQGVVWNNGGAPALGNGFALLWQSPAPTTPASSVPTLQSINPSTAPLFSPDLTITLAGSNFTPDSLVEWFNTDVAPEPPGTILPTTYVSATQLTAILPSAFTAPYNSYGVGTVQALGVVNPGLGGGTSNTIPFNVVGPGVPAITSVSPSSASAGDFSMYVDIKGNNLWSATANWNGQALFTTVVSNNEMYAAIPSSLLASPGTAQMQAVSSSPGGGVSAAVPFTIGLPSPSAAGPASAFALEGTPHQTVQSDGSTKNGPKLHNPVRFYGWNYAKQQGPAYLKYFSRPYGRGNIPRQGVGGTVAGEKAAAGTMETRDSTVNLTQPTSLPGFAFHPTLPAGFIPTSVATGDFNHDGKMDWVVSNGGSNSLWIYFGNGDGTSQLPRIIPLTGAGPSQVAVADLRKIGVLDLVVAEADSQTVGVLLGNGDGTFQPESTYYVPGPPISIAVGDTNADGKPDIVAGILGGSPVGPLVTLLGDGTGNFGKPVPTLSFDDIGSFFTTTVVLTDLNGDGILDALVVDQGGVIPGAHSYLGQGDGSFKHADFIFGTDAFTVVTNLAAADVDGDGCTDVVTVEALGLVRLFKGTCDGGFQGFPNVPTFGAGEAGISVALADMNGDGNLDIVTSGGFFGVGAGFGEEASNLVTVLLGDGHGNFSVPKVYRTEPSLVGLAAADLNGDGRPEIIAVSQDTDTAIVLKNDGTGNLDGPSGAYVGYIAGGQQGATNAPYSNFLVQDLNGDGKPDLAFVEAEQSYSTPWEFTTMLNDGTGHFGPATRTPMADFGNAPTDYILGDFRGTGRPDALVSAAGYQGKPNADLIFLPNNGDGTFGNAQISLMDLGISSLGLIAAGDFNKDGKLDFVATTFSANPAAGGPAPFQLTTFLGNGDGTFRIGSSAQFPSAAFNAGPYMIFVGDYNRDGNLDVLVWTYVNVVGVQNVDNLFEFLGNGDGTFAPGKLILPNLSFFGMADLNGDGYPDIVELNQVEPNPPTYLLAPNYTIYLGQPDGTFKQGQTYSFYSGTIYPGYGFSNAGPNQGLTPMLADFNGDGKIDIGVLMVSPPPNGTSYMQVLAGNGDGTFVPTYEIIPFDKFGMPTNAADVNGDGRADLLEIDGWPSSYNVILNAAGPTVQLAFPSQPIVGTNGSVVVNLSVVSATSETVQLSASDPNIQISSSISIPAGSLSATVPFTISAAFDSSKVFSISAQLSGQISTIYSYQASSALVGLQLFSNAAKESTPPGGTTHDFALGVVSVGGYSTTVQFSCQGLPAGATCLFGANSVTLPAGQSIGDALTIQTTSATPLGIYPIIVVGSDGIVSGQITLTLNVADFAINVIPASATGVSGFEPNFSMSLTALGAWSDPINVSCTVSGPPGLGCYVGGSFLTGTTSFTEVTNGAVPGDYTLNITASADGVTHAASPVVIHVQGASGTTSPSSSTLTVGGSAPFNVAVTSLNGYTDQFTFSCPNLPTGLTCSFTPPSGTLPANGSLATVLQISATALPAVLPVPYGPGLPPMSLPSAWAVAATCFGLFLCFMGYSQFVRSRGQPTSRLAFAASVVLFCGIITSCGGGSLGVGAPPPPPPPPPQSVTVTVSVQATSPALTVNAGIITLQVH